MKEIREVMLEPTDLKQMITENLGARPDATVEFFDKNGNLLTYIPQAVVRWEPTQTASDWGLDPVKEPQSSDNTLSWEARQMGG